MLDGHGWHAEQVGQKLDLDGIGSDVRLRDDAEARAVGDQLVSIAVENATSGCEDKDSSGSVTLGLGAVVVDGDELHAPKSDKKRPDNGSREDLKAKKPVLEPRLGRAVPSARRRGDAAAYVKGEAAVAPT